MNAELGHFVAATRPLSPQAEMPKNSFPDLAGRVWLLKLNCGLAQRIHETLGVDLANAHNGQAFQQLGGDSLLLIKTLAMLVETQLAESSVTPEAFVEGLDDATLETAGEAIGQMIVLFTRPAIRPVIKTMLAKGKEAQQAVINLAETKLSGPAMSAAIQRELTRIDQQIEQALAEKTAVPSMPTSSPSNGPAL